MPAARAHAAASRAMGALQVSTRQHPSCHDPLAPPFLSPLGRVEGDGRAAGAAAGPNLPILPSHPPFPSSLGLTIPIIPWPHPSCHPLLQALLDASGAAELAAALRAAEQTPEVITA